MREKPAPANEAVLAALAHDVRTPLTGILALSELLSASDLPARERGWAQAIKSAAEHLAQSTTLVLDAVKAGRHRLVLRHDIFSPRKFADEVAQAFAARAGAGGLAAQVSIAGDLPAQVIGDPVRLRAALENLIDNAVKFTPRGTVTLDVAARRQSGRRVQLVFAVTDSGIGLTRAQIARLFRPFAQASSEIAQLYGGSGLGLALVKRLARAMGGNLTVESEPGRGSTFTLRVQAQTVERPPRAAARAAQGTAAPLHILCAEDNPFGRVVLNTILTQFGHRVDFAGSGDAAVAAVAAKDYDLVLMDVTLPGISGLEATRRIRALPGRAARVPVIGISALVSTADLAQAREAGMNDYLVKPVGAAALAEALQRIATGAGGAA